MGASPTTDADDSVGEMSCRDLSSWWKVRTGESQLTESAMVRQDTVSIARGFFAAATLRRRLFSPRIRFSKSSLDTQRTSWRIHHEFWSAKFVDCRGGSRPAWRTLAPAGTGKSSAQISTPTPTDLAASTSLLPQRLRPILGSIDHRRVVLGSQRRQQSRLFSAEDIDARANNGMNQRPAEFSGSAAIIDENAARSTLRGRAAGYPQPFGRPPNQLEVVRL